MNAPSRSWAAIYESGRNVYAVRVVFSDETGVGSIKEEPLCVVVALLMNLDEQWDVLHSDCGKPWSVLQKRLNAEEMKGRKLLGRLRRKDDPEVHAVLRTIVGSLVTHRVPLFYEAVGRASLNDKNAEDASKEELSRSPNEVEELHGPFGLGLAYKRAYGAHFARKLGMPGDAHSIAFGLCVRQVDQYVHAMIPREKILWISDHCPRSERNLKSSAWTHKFHSAIERKLGQMVGFTDDGFVSHLVDTVYFGDSKESFMLQLADLCCSVVTGHLLRQQPAESYYEIL